MGARSEDKDGCGGPLADSVVLFLLAFSLINAYVSKELWDQAGDTFSEMETELDLLNNTRRANQRVVVFNRVTKAGTTSMCTWIRLLAARNDFDSYMFRVPSSGVDIEITHMGPLEVNNTIDTLSTTCGEDRDCEFHKHMYFVDFERLNRTNPIYINMVRHPVERLLSWYYYVRTTRYISTQASVSVQRLKTSLDECVLKTAPCHISLLTRAQKEKTYVEHMMDSGHRQGREARAKKRPVKMSPEEKVRVSRIVAEDRMWAPPPDPTCPDIKNPMQFDEVSSQLIYFCGYGVECRAGPGSTMRLSIAMKNVETRYAVVGILEELEDTIRVMEAYVPRYFAGFSSDIRRPTVNENKGKPKLSPEARVALEAYLWDEIAFYEFCRQRLHRQLKAISFNL